jgi:16S rRNA processing protein RimM
MPEKFLAVGKLRRPHGVRGDIQMEVLTDFPERLKRGIIVFVGEQFTPLRILRVRWHSQVLLVQFEGYSTPEQAGELRNQIVFVSASDRPRLPEGEFYHHELAGLRVMSENGEELGFVEQILETGANDVLAVRRSSGQEFLIPYHDAFVIHVDLANGTITVRVMPGLLEE